MSLGTGIGGAYVILGTESKDILIIPSELGHMVIEKNGRPCHCGKNGCFETYCSMRAFKKGIIELLNLNEETTSEELLTILKNQSENETLNNYIDNYIDTLTLGISNIVNIFKPEKICIGGSFTYFEGVLYKRLVEKAKNYKYQFEVPQIVLAKFQNDAGIIGAVVD